MTNYWWVNHNQTFEQESQGGYLWSPKREANGARSQFYDNMHKARVGDLVVSFAGARIRAIGRVDSEAVTAPKPAAFGAVGLNWAASGWLLPVSWSSVLHEPKPADYLADIAPLLPDKYSPIIASSGRGSQKAYLAAISEALFKQVLLLTGGTVGYARPAIDAGTWVALQEAAQVQQLYQDKSLSDTQRERLIAARSGQGVFRDNLLKSDEACVITGVTDPRLLRASHIVPWRDCKTAEDRLSAANGLLLTPMFDHLFDRKLMTFDEYGQPVLSSTLSAVDTNRLALSGLKGRYSLRHHEAYLAIHRQEFFIR